MVGIDLKTAKMSQAAVDKLIKPSEGHGKEHKGVGFECYLDPIGIPTGGWGHTARAGDPKPSPDKVWSYALCEQTLRNDLRDVERAVADMLRGAKLPVLQCEYDALCSGAFNFGAGALRTSSLLRAYLAGDRATAAAKFMDWVRSDGKVLDGLVKRRRWERSWFLTGELPRTGAVGFAGAQIFESWDIAALPHSVDHGDYSVEEYDGPRWPAMIVVAVLFGLVLLACWLAFKG